MKCSHCQAEVNAGELFCGDCGRPITVAETRAKPPSFAPSASISGVETAAASEPATTKPVHRAGKTGMLAAVAAAFVVGAGLAGWVVLKMRSPAPVAAPATPAETASSTPATSEPTIDALRPHHFEQSFTVSLSSSVPGERMLSTRIGAPSTDGGGRVVPVAIEDDFASSNGITLREGAKVDDQLKAFLQAIVPRNTKGESLPEPPEDTGDVATVLAPSAENAAEIRVLSTEAVHEIDRAAPSSAGGRLFRIKRPTPLLASPGPTARVITRLPTRARIQVSEAAGDYDCVRDDAGNIAGYILRADLGPDDR